MLSKQLTFPDKPAAERAERRGWDLNPRWVAPHTISNPILAVRRHPTSYVVAGQKGYVVRRHPPLIARIRSVVGQLVGQE